MNFENQKDVQDQIEKLITSADSPVGIDAKKNPCNYNSKTS